ncbi:MAG TPA: ANTAR domain-containing protein [Mycobacteriales bacterium]|nr:ANTAR domain-containing protein [Mycobacteriales bacterium]
MTAVAELLSVEAAAVTIRTESRAQEMLGASSGWSAKLEEIQYTLGEGPGSEAVALGGPILVPDLVGDQARWPIFAEAALPIGAAAVFSFPLQMGAIALGTLNLYRRRPGGLMPTELGDAAVLAELTTMTLLKQTEMSERSGIELLRPIASYQDVNIATGMLAAQLHITLSDAFARLRGYAFSDGRSVVEVAQDVVQQRIDMGLLADQSD